MTGARSNGMAKSLSMYHLVNLGYYKNPFFCDFCRFNKPFSEFHPLSLYLFSHSLGDAVHSADAQWGARRRAAHPAAAAAGVGGWCKATHHARVGFILLTNLDSLSTSN